MTDIYYHMIYSITCQLLFAKNSVKDKNILLRISFLNNAIAISLDIKSLQKQNRIKDT